MAKLQEQYKRQIHLSTPVGDQLSDAVIDISYYVDDMDCDRDFEYNYQVAVRVQYVGQEFWGRGTSYYWVDAFADLQKQLPPDVTLKCCLTCRHGNMCPVGNKQDELFCTEDVLIKQKSDLYFYTEDYDERDKRSRGYTSVCGKHQPQTEDFFTYNDYLYQFNK